MALDLVAIHEALAGQIDAAVIDAHIYAHVPGAPLFPFIAIAGDVEYVNYWGTFSDGGNKPVRLTVVVGVAKGPGPEAQRTLDEFLSSGAGYESTSIVDAIHADKTLGGVIDDCVVRGASGPRLADFSGTEAWVSELSVEIQKLRG